MWIIDASVIVKWFFIDEPLRDKAIELQNSLINSPSKFPVPYLLYSELLHVLSRKSGKEEQFVQEALDIILRIGLPTLFLNNEGLMNAAKFSCQGFSGYDATYLGLACQLGAKWLTADTQAAKKAPKELALDLASWPQSH